jgi:hypothetical protein
MWGDFQKPGGYCLAHGIIQNLLDKAGYDIDLPTGLSPVSYLSKHLDAIENDQTTQKRLGGTTRGLSQPFRSWYKMHKKQLSLLCLRPELTL